MSAAERTSERTSGPFFTVPFQTKLSHCGVVKYYTKSKILKKRYTTRIRLKFTLFIHNLYHFFKRKLFIIIHYQAALKKCFLLVIISFFLLYTFGRNVRLNKEGSKITFALTNTNSGKKKSGFCPRRNIIPTRTIIQGGWVSSSLSLSLSLSQFQKMDNF